MNNFSKKEILLVLLCLLVGFVLRFYTFDQKSLWVDEVYTFNDSRYGFKEQIAFYKENPTFLHPPLFFILTHQFYPFNNPERELRIIPLIFGTLSIPIFYLLARQFSTSIAIPCTISLTFMTYHISLSQDGRSYALLMFFGMVCLYFFLRYLKTSEKLPLILTSLFYALLFHTSYSSIPFMISSQLLWFYRFDDGYKNPTRTSFLTLISLTLIFCLPWVIFLGLNYKNQPIMNPYHTEILGSLLSILYWILNDWTPHLPLMIASAILLFVLPFFANNKKNAIILLALFSFPMGGLILFCKYLNITHFITSRYFIIFFPLFLMSIYLSLHSIEMKLHHLKTFIRFTFIFILLFIGSNVTILPLYYQSQKQDIKGMVSYLKSHLKPGDKIFDGDRILTPGILHYFGVYPKGRQYSVKFKQEAGNIIEYRKSFQYQNELFTIYWSNSCCTQYVADGSRLWIAVGKDSAKIFKEDSAFVFTGYFDGSFLNWTRFPTDASIYLFLLDPSSPYEKGIDRLIK